MALIFLVLIFSAIQKIPIIRLHAQYGVKTKTNSLEQKDLVLCFMNRFKKCRIFYIKTKIFHIFLYLTLASYSCGAYFSLIQKQ